MSAFNNNEDLDRMTEICRDLSTQYESGDDSVGPLLELVATLIEKYEDEHIHFNGNPEWEAETHPDPYRTVD